MSIKRWFIADLCAIVLMAGTANAARIFVGIAPPPVVVEHPGPIPNPGWVWVGGYWRWTGHHYVWAHGHWVYPPRPGAVWVPLTGTLVLEVGSLSQVTGLDQVSHPWHRAQIIGALMGALCETRPAVHSRRRCVPCVRQDDLSL